MSSGAQLGFQPHPLGVHVGQQGRGFPHQTVDAAHGLRGFLVLVGEVLELAHQVMGTLGGLQDGRHGIPLVRRQFQLGQGGGAGGAGGDQVVEIVAQAAHQDAGGFRLLAADQLAVVAFPELLERLLQLAGAGGQDPPGP